MMDKFVFGDVDTENFRAYVFPKEVDSVPVREYEEITIPGRNGTYIIDGGRYENVEHIYDVILKSDTAEADYISLKNKLSTMIGYHKLSDTIAPGEYYEARLSEITTPVTTPERDGIKFEVVFDRKPQRFLLSGEVEEQLESGEFITNPTLFDASPLLMVYGSGDITFGDKTISITNSLLGKRKIADKVTARGYNTTYTEGVITGILGTAVVTFDDSLMMTGDKIWFGGTDRCRFTLTDDNPDRSWGIHGNYTLPFDADLITTSSQGFVVYMAYNDPKGASYFFRYGTAKTDTEVRYIDLEYTSGTTLSYTLTTTFTYDGQSTIRVEMLIEGGDLTNTEFKYMQIPELWAKTTLSTLGNPLYIDCETGAAYKYVSGEYVSVNSSVWMGAYMPVLPPGDTEVSYSGNISALQIVPRWWTI